MQFTIKDGNGETEPSTYAVCPAMGSAYYLYGGDDALQQVSLGEGDIPDFEPVPEVEDPEDKFFGGGEVDWDRGFETDSQRIEVSRISEALKGATIGPVKAEV
jgi:hypothetical protein